MKRALLVLGFFAAAELMWLPAVRLAQKAVFVVRHAEKASDANEPSVPLSEAGTARAARLAALLKDAGVSAIYSTDAIRTRKTAEPLAAARKREIRIDEPIGSDGKVSLKALTERLRRENPSDVVLAVGHSNTIGPVSIAGDESDSLFVVVPRGKGPPELLRLRY